LTRIAGDASEAEQLLKKAEAIPLNTARDRYLLLTTQLDRGRLHAVLPYLRDASRKDANNSSVWLILGNCYTSLGKRSEAIACYDLGIALWPNGHWAYFRRGSVHLELKDYRQAQADFDEVIRLRPDLREAYFNRAVARLALGDTAGARQDLTHILQVGPPQLRLYFARARVREKEGDMEGARRDREEGMRQAPMDEQDWTVRGLARQKADPQAALEDFDRALQINPQYRAALQNKANVLSERLGRPEEAVAVLDQVLLLFPDYLPARAGRGVLLARLGHREAAHRDARDCLENDRQPFTFYQVAGIYALTARQEPDDRHEAFRLLATALRDGTGLDLVDSDRDLDQIRNEPEFNSLVEASRALRAGGVSRAKP
jgi:tetratricopeptide (TPR) repeat protein